MCGIIGIYNYENNQEIVKQTYEGLKKQQHRGRDSYGFLFYNIMNPILVKNTGKIQEPDFKISNINKTLGHTKYTTSEYRTEIKSDKDMLNVTQPFRGMNTRLGEFYLVHNGNIRDLDLVKANFDLQDTDILNDSHLLVKIIESLELQRWEDIINQIMLSIEGSFSVILLTRQNMYCFKDLRAYRPLCIGNNISGYCIASETVGLGEYKYIKEVERGEILKIGQEGMEKMEIFVDLSKINEKKCLFEYIYFLNAESVFLNGEKQKISVRQYRYQFGIELGKNEKYKNLSKEAIVIGAPMTGIPSGMGFADILKYQYSQILVKNKNSGRSFILKTDEERINECKKKFIIENGELMYNKEVFFVDDSLVRGNTLKVIIELLRKYKPKKIHIRITCPKVLNICEYGIDIPSREELIMNWNTDEEFIKKIGADSINFLNINDMFNIMGNKNYCVNCFESNKEIEW